MHRLEKLVTDFFGPSTVIGEKLYYRSKKNQVTSLSLQVAGESRHVLVKYFVWGQADKEEKILRDSRNRGIPVPAVYHRHRNILLLEYIEGESLNARLLENRSILGGLAAWLALFHQAMASRKGVLLKRDMRLHNFIHREGTLWGIDFEEAAPGDRELDVADLLASLMEISRESGKSASLSLMRSFLAYYRTHHDLDREKLEQYLILTLKERARYRKDLKIINDEWIGSVKNGDLKLFKLPISPAESSGLSLGSLSH